MPPFPLKSEEWNQIKKNESWLLFKKREKQKEGKIVIWSPGQ